MTTPHEIRDALLDSVLFSQCELQVNKDAPGVCNVKLQITPGVSTNSTSAHDEALRIWRDVAPLPLWPSFTFYGLPEGGPMRIEPVDTWARRKHLRYRDALDELFAEVLP